MRRHSTMPRLSPRRVISGVATALLMALLVALGPGSTTAHAQADQADLGLDVSFALGDSVGSGAWQPLTITLAPEVPVSGVAQVQREANEGITVIEVPVEVSAGTTKQWTILVPPGDGMPSVRVQSGDLEDNAFGGIGNAGGPVVGILGLDEFVERVGAVTDAVTDEVWDTVELDPNVLDHGPLAIEALGTVTTDSTTLADLDDVQRATLATAINLQGLHLVVVDATEDPGIGRAPASIDGDTLAVLPAAWPVAIDGDRVTTADGDRAGAATTTSGLGRVTWLSPQVADASLSSPRMWGQLWTGSPMATVDPWSRGSIIDPWLLQQAGLALPSSWAMTGFAAAYLVVMGITCLVVVRRLRRRERAWVILPVVALVLAGVAVAAAGSNQSSPGRVMASGVWIDGAGLQRVVMSTPPEADGVDLPGPGWAVQGLTWERPSLVSPGPDGTRVRASTGANAFGPSMVMATRAAAAPPPLAVDAASTADGVLVEVTNTSDRSLRDVRVSAGDHPDAQVAELAAGDTIVVELDGDDPIVDGQQVPAATGRWQPASAMAVDDTRGAVPEEMVVGPDGVFEGDMMIAEQRPGGLVDHANREVETNAAFVWVRATSAPGLVDAPSAGASEPDVLAVATTPVVGTQVRATGTNLVWQPSGQHHTLALREGMLWDAGTTWFRTTVPGPGDVASLDNLRVDVPRTESDDGCVDYLVHQEGFNGQGSRDEQVCDGEFPPCPEDAECSQWEEGRDVCDESGCEFWERLQGDMHVAVFDRVDREFRPWDDDFAAAVATTPDRIVGPLGDVVVEVTGTGNFRLDRIEVGTEGVS